MSDNEVVSCSHGPLHWKVSGGASSRQVGAWADKQMCRVADETGEYWKASGERACFRIPESEIPGGLEAGWYELSGRLRARQAAPLHPCLYPSYLAPSDGDMQIGLPEPDSRGKVSTLVLFKYPVSDIRFCPSFVPAEFRIGEFQLKRLGRAGALWRMVKPEPAEGLTGWFSVPVRMARFLLNAGRDGLSLASGELFRGYRRRINLPEASSYEEWYRRYDTLTEERIAMLRERSELLASTGPVISILLPTYQTPERWLRRCLDSVMAQVYPRWELCIADDASPDPKVVRTLEEYARRDRRIRFVRRETNGHISAASNSALELATGEYVGLLDHDDELRPHALLEMVEAIGSRDDVGLVYSDEDKLDMEGRRFDPYFKPDWDPDLLRGQNFVCHFTVIRRNLVLASGGFREGFEGSQDHDIILRCTEQLRPDQIRHIPKVLYHWRAIPGSTALTRDAKDYASSAGVRAVAEHLGRSCPGAEAQELSHGHYRVRWPLPEHPPKVSLIIPTRDKVELLRLCISSIQERSTYPNYQIVIMDNGSSTAETLSYLESLTAEERIRVVRHDAPFNYAELNNTALSYCDGDVIGLVNNDIEVITPDWLEEMVSQALRPDVGAVGAMLYYPNDTIQHAGVMLGIHGVAAHIYAGLPRGYPGHGGRARVQQTMSAVTGACLILRRSVYEQAGGLDERLAVAFNDIDLCLRVRDLGYRNIWTPFAELYHHESASRGQEDSPEKRERFASEVRYMMKRWGKELMSDPAYNLNLSLQHTDSRLAFPPN